VLTLVLWRHRRRRRANQTSDAAESQAVDEAHGEESGDPDPIDEASGRSGTSGGD
jgi:hypothetical protein